MITKQFGQYLLQKGAISREELLLSLKTQRERSPVVGELAVSMGFMSTEDAEKINRAQIQKDVPFGKLAVQMDMMTEEQVETVISKQIEQRQPINEILVELGYVSQSEVGCHLADYDTELSAREMGFEFAIDDDSERMHISQYIEKSTAIFERLLKRELHYSKIVPLRNIEDREQITYSLTISLQKTEVELGIGVENHLCLDIASAIMDQKATTIDEIAIDCVGEFLNTIMGYLIMEPYYVANRTNIAPPIQHQWSKFSAKTDGFCFEMQSEADVFWLYFCERPL